MRCKLGMLLCSAFVSVAAASVSVADEIPGRLQELPPLLRAVSDEPGVLSLGEGQSLSRRISEVEHDTGVKMVALVVGNVAPESVEAYTQRLINHWKRHSRTLDNGRFVFIVIAKNDREVRIVPGPELAWVLKSLSKNEMTENAPKLLRKDQYYEALLAIVNTLSQIITSRHRMVRLEGVSQDPIHRF